MDIDGRTARVHLGTVREGSASSSSDEGISADVFDAAGKKHHASFAAIDYLAHYDKGSTDSESSDEEESEARRPWRRAALGSLGASTRLASLEAALAAASASGVDASSAGKLIQRYSVAQEEQLEASRPVPPGRAAQALDAALVSATRLATAHPGKAAREARRAAREAEDAELGYVSDASSDSEGVESRVATGVRAGGRAPPRPPKHGEGAAAAARVDGGQRALRGADTDEAM